MKRFVLGTDRTTPEQDRAFIDILNMRHPGIGWWHQLGEMWLISTHSDSLTTAELRDAATQAFPGVSLIVIEAAGPNCWSGFGTPKEFTWLSGSWDVG